MIKINRLITNICSNDLEKSKHFYTTLFDFKIAFEGDWFIQLISENSQFELGIIDKSNQLIPKEYQNSPNGFYLTFVVDNTDELFEIAKESDFRILEEPKDTFYGQRRLLLKDPDGAMIDISSPLPGFGT